MTSPADSPPLVHTPAPATYSTPAVEVLSAEKTYPNGTQALLPVDLTIEEGEFVTLLGPSGCGKSTLLKMVAGLLEPTDGRLHLWRKPVAQLDESGKKMAFVFQSPTLMPWASVQTNVRLPLDLAGVPRAEADARAKASYDFLVAAKLIDPTKVKLAETYTTAFVKDLKVLP